MWLETLVKIAASGYAPGTVLLVSAASTLFRLRSLRRQTIRTATVQPRRARLRSVLFVVALASSLSLGILAVVKDDMAWPHAALLGYAFLLGLVKLVASPSAKRLLANQLIYVCGASLLLFLAAYVLPLIRLSSPTPRFSKHVACCIGTLAAALMIQLSSPRVWTGPPVQVSQFYEKDIQPTKEETCSPLDYIFSFDRVNGVIKRGFRSNLTLADIPSLAWYNAPALVLTSMGEERSRSKNTLRAVLRFARSEITWTAIAAAIMFAAGFLGPYSLYRILSYLANPEAAILHPYVWIAVMILGRVIRLAASQKHSFALSRMTARVKAALSAEMYDRLLSSKELSDNFLATPVSDPQAQVPTASGQLTNLLSSDLSIISMAGPSIMILVGVPVGIILGVFGLYKVIGWPSFVGILIIIICIPLPSWIIKNVGGLQMSAREAQDSRLSLASEYFGALRLIKYFAWEQYVEDRINQSRKEEQKHLWKIEAMFVVMGEVTELIPVVALLAIFLLHTVILHQPLTAAVAFTTISLMTTLKAHLNLLGIIAPRLTNASISFKRLDKFFETTEPRAAVPTGPLRIKDATILRGSKNPFKLHNVSAEFVQGGLNVVSGSTGSGKTTLLLALLGETELQQGAVYCPAEVAYASQVPWIQPRTVKENIVFDAPFNESRYAEVIRACHLTVDIDSLAEGDATVLDESGSNLSGELHGLHILAFTNNYKVGSELGWALRARCTRALPQ